ncbi:sensor domain-containing diguanylate cyclase [Bordetella genomosp. 13]|uniref:GGDEF domain-containing protein n=1 Tax=Bordetella genomosp. 13 TaxID=463040 RepID=UPI0011A73AEB|nr:diguanylate cyclase [Bordetella genomosp. 13]
METEGSLVRVSLSLITPTILTLFGAAFVAIWAGYQRRSHLLCLAAACFAFGAGATSQILYVPRDTGANALVSGALYSSAVCLAVQGILLRARRRFPWTVCAAFVALVMAGLWYFFYVDRNLLARVYLLNASYGLLFCLAALRLWSAPRVRMPDRLLFWIVLALGLQFLPRTLLTLGGTAPVGARAFADSIFWQGLQLSLALFGIALGLVLLFAVASDVLEAAIDDRDRDLLTGAYTRRGFDLRTRKRLAGSATPSALILADVDHFKRINDRHGHPAGDRVLAAVSEALSGNLRAQDILGRLGGEEFAVFMPRAGLREAVECAERLRTAIAGSGPAMLEGEPVTISLGVVEIPPGTSWDIVYQQADEKLYEAKRAGRDRVAW